jgi:hypothetical protein
LEQTAWEGRFCVLRPNTGLGSSRERRRTCETVLWMAGWTAEGGVLNMETREELDTAELGYIWQNAGQTGIRTRRHITNFRCDDIQWQRRLDQVREKRSLSLYGGWKHSCGTELHTSCGSYCAWKQRYSTVQTGNLEILARGGTERGRYLLWAK